MTAGANRAPVLIRTPDKPAALLQRGPGVRFELYHQGATGSFYPVEQVRKAKYPACLGDHHACDTDPDTRQHVIGQVSGRVVPGCL